MKGVCPIDVRVRRSGEWRGGTGNRNPEAWSGIERCKVSGGQVWYRFGQRRISAYHRSDRWIWGSNLWPFWDNKPLVHLTTIVYRVSIPLIVTVLFD